MGRKIKMSSERLIFMGPCDSLNDNGDHKFTYLVSGWWNYLRKIRRFDFVRGDLSLGSDFEISKD